MRTETRRIIFDDGRILGVRGWISDDLMGKVQVCAVSVQGTE